MNGRFSRSVRAGVVAGVLLAAFLPPGLGEEPGAAAQPAVGQRAGSPPPADAGEILAPPDTVAEAPAARPSAEAMPSAEQPAADIAPQPREEAVPDGTEATVPEPEHLAPPSAQITPSRQGSNLISVTLDDVPLQDVVRMFTRISGANIIANSSNLQGKVTVNIQDVEWKPALASILDMHKLVLMEKEPGSGIYSITPAAPGAPEPRVATTIMLSFASVSNVVPIVQRILGENGTVSAFPAGNALIVHAPAANVAEIQKMVKEIDLPREQVYIEAKFLELSDEAIKDLGINWQMLEGYKIGVGSLKGSVEDKRVRTKTQTDRLSQADNRNRQDNINELYDMYGNQYEEKTLITEEYPPGSGLYRTREVPTPTRTVQDNIGQSRDVSSLLEDSLVRTLTDIRTAVLTADDLKLVLSALKQQAGISIASNPKIIVANEETALIKIADEEPNVRITRERATVQGQPDLTTSQLDPQQPTFTYGITLEVTPTINTASNITLRIKPVLSRWLKDKVAPDGNTFPIISTKTITTTFSLESGMTAAIGGLTETLDRDAQAKVPLLGDVPLVGKLFTHSHRQRSQKETIIFVTVGLATPEAIERDHGLPENAKLIHRHLQPEEQSPKRARTKDARHLRETAVRELERKP